MMLFLLPSAESDPQIPWATYIDSGPVPFIVSWVHLAYGFETSRRRRICIIVGQIDIGTRRPVTPDFASAA
jgi:hypothetical protein